MRIGEILTSQSYWEKTAVVIAGGTGSGHATAHGIVAGGACSFSEDLYSNNYTDRPGRWHVEEPPSYTRKNAIRNKEFYRLFCKNLPSNASYLGLSENITKEDLERIVDDIKEVVEEYNPPELILVTTGTDAMEQVARYINKELGDLIRKKGVRVILTGANRDLSRDDTDIWENLEFAFESGFRKDIIPGVYVAFHNSLTPADLVVKEPFNGDEMNYISRSSPRYWSSVLRHNVKDLYTISRLWWKLGWKDQAANTVVDYPVNVIRENHDEFRELLKSNPVRAVLFILYHSSTANTLKDKPEMSVAKLAQDLRDEGKRVFAVTENGEPVNLTATAYETSVRLAEAGVIGLGNMTRNVALAKLRMCARGTDEEFMQKMSTSYVGEFAIS